MENTEHTKYTRTMLFALAILLLGASIVGFIVTQRMQSTQRGTDATQVQVVPTVVPTLIPYPTKGIFTLKARPGQQSGSVGTPFTIDLIATSSKDTVAGYDAILSYDTTSLTRQSVQNSVDSFRIFTFDRGDHLSLSATKNLQVTTPILFTNTTLLSFTFTAKKAGSYVFSLKPVGNESSKLVNESAQVTYPETSDIRIEIK